MEFNESDYNEYKRLIYSDFTPEQSVEFYTKYANYYDNFCDFESYRAHEVAVDGLVGLGLDKSIRILDVGAGRGKIGRLLKSLGFNNVDAIDGTPAMLNAAKSDGIYKNYIHCLIHKDTKLPIEDNVYDATIASGAIGIGHIGIEVLPELIRIIKPGITHF
jgi:ubiquinone/menaquinone biosynthesis C-methylase UbiE